MLFPFWWLGAFLLIIFYIEIYGKTLKIAYALFGTPQRGWDLWYSLRSCVSACVRSAEISKSVHMNFLIFGTELDLPNGSDIFGFCPKNPVRPFLAHFFFGKKMAIFGQKSTFQPISQNLLIDLLSFAYLNFVFGLFMKYLS